MKSDDAGRKSHDLEVLAHLAARTVGSPAAFVARLDGDRLDFPAWHGPELSRARLEPLCRDVLLQPEVFAIADAREHPRWARQPLVAGEGGLRFFAGTVLRDEGGLPRGLLACLGFEPRTLDEKRRAALADIGRLAAAKLAGDPGDPRSPAEEEEGEDEERHPLDDTLHSREHYRSVVKVMAEGILLRAADGRILTCNTSAERILGLSRAQLVGDEPRPPGWRLLREDLSPLAEDDLPTSITLRTGKPCIEKVLAVDKGEAGIAWISLNTQPLLRPGASEPHAAVASFTDITHLRRTQGALHEALCRTEELGKLFEIANAMVCIVGFDGRFRQVNPAWERFLGYPLEELLATPIAELIHPEDQSLSAREADHLRASGVERISFENRLRHRDGSYRWLSWNATVDLATMRFYAVASDVTDRRRAQAEREALIRQLEEKNAELERYTYTVSHDLKSPLLTIRGFLGYVERSARAGDLDRLGPDLERIHGAAERMQQLLDELLELSRIGRIVHPPREVSLSTIAREAAALVPCELGDRTVEVRIPDDLPVVLCDATRLRQVFQNLIANAVKFMGDQPAPRVEIEAERSAGVTLCRVRDNGIGIDPRYQGRVFALFEQIDPHAGGTGVGLAVVRRIVEVHGGRVWVESAGSGHGACFSFTLPDAPAGATATPETGGRPVE